MNYDAMSFEAINWVFWLACFSGIVSILSALFLARLYMTDHPGFMGGAAKAFFGTWWSAPALMIALGTSLFFAVTSLQYKAEMAAMANMAAEVHFAFTRSLGKDSEQIAAFKNPEAVMLNAWNTDIEPLVTTLTARGYLPASSAFDSEVLAEAAFAFGSNHAGI